jgi:hypothetical protein
MYNDDIRYNKKAITIIYRAFEKDLEIRELDISKVNKNFLTSMRCLELIDFIKIQESKSFSFNIQIMFNFKYNLNFGFFQSMLLNNDEIHVFTHGLTTQPEHILISSPIYLIKFQINPLKP